MYVCMCILQRKKTFPISVTNKRMKNLNCQNYTANHFAVLLRTTRAAFSRYQAPFKTTVCYLIAKLEANYIIGDRWFQPRWHHMQMKLKVL